MAKLVLMRHGESEANFKNIFTGWDDVPLTKKGKEQAKLAGQTLKSLNIPFGTAHTSYLKRAIMTEDIILNEINQLWVPQFKTWRLNERHYGNLKGKNKSKVKQQVGSEQLKIWRRSFKAIPPQLRLDDLTILRRYRQQGLDMPLGESLEMTLARILPYWQDNIAPRLLDNKNQLVVVHGSSVRALVKFLEDIDDVAIEKLEIPNGQPIVYEFDAKLQIIDKKVYK